MINLLSKNIPKQLGDRIDFLLLAHMLSIIKNEQVNISNNIKSAQFLKDNLFSFGDVHISSQNEGKKIVSDNSFYLTISKQIDIIPINTNINLQTNVDHPSKYVTAQWDAAQLYRRVDRWDSERIDNIESWYKHKGYKVIRIGGEGDYSKLEDIIPIISKAEYHIGADSGMAHVAKMLLPIQNIHLYVNIRNRYNDKRFPDNWNVPFMARELFRRGAKMNFCETPTNEQVEYFKNVSFWE